MAEFKLVATAYPDAASNTSLTSAFQIPKDFTHFMLAVPSLFAVTSTCAIKILGSETQTGTYSVVSYSQNPSTSTVAQSDWMTSSSQAVSGALVIAEGFQFVPGWAKLQFANTATANVAFKIYGRKFD